MDAEVWMHKKSGNLFIVEPWNYGYLIVENKLDFFMVKNYELGIYFEFLGDL